MATRSSVKVQPASVQSIGQVTGGCKQRNLANAVPPPGPVASPQGQESHHLPLPTAAAAIWSAVDSKLKGAVDSHCKKKAKTAANWETLYVYVASVYEDFAEVKESTLLPATDRTSAHLASPLCIVYSLAQCRYQPTITTYMHSAVHAQCSTWNGAL